MCILHVHIYISRLGSKVFTTPLLVDVYRDPGEGCCCCCRFGLLCFDCPGRGRRRERGVAVKCDLYIMSAIIKFHGIRNAGRGGGGRGGLTLGNLSTHCYTTCGRARQPVGEATFTFMLDTHPHTHTHTHSHTHTHAHTTHIFAQCLLVVVWLSNSKCDSNLVVSFSVSLTVSISVCSPFLSLSLSL